MHRLTGLGRRLAAAGREARGEVAAAAGPVGGQVAEAAAAAVGELVRCAVAGAISATVRGSRSRAAKPDDDPWDESDGSAGETTTDAGIETPVSEATDVTAGTVPNPGRPRWGRATRVVGSALTVAAGAAASVPGGKLVAAGLGGLAAVVTLAARVGETPAGG